MRKAHLMAGIAAIAALGMVSPATSFASVFDNTLTGLIPDIYVALDTVSRELVGFIPSVRRDSGVERAAVGEAVKWPVTRAATSSDIVAAMVPPTPAARTVDAKQLTIQKAKKVNFAYTGEEMKGLNNGPGTLSIQQDEIAQAFRTLCNEIEQDIASAGIAAASRAYGTPGTTPFASDLSPASNLRKILDDNGAPLGTRSLVINTTTGVNVRNLTQLTKVNEAGTSMTLRDGELLNIFGFSMKESAAVMAHTKGTGALATTNNAGYAVGSTTITLASAGTGTFTAGDVITFAGDANKYVVLTGDADVSNGGSITINKPGLLVAIPAVATAITIANSYSAGLAFTQNSLVLAARLPALPDGRDMARDRIQVIDQRSGLVFDIAEYLGYHMVSYEISIAWGVGSAKDEHIALLLG